MSISNKFRHIKIVVKTFAFSAVNMLKDHKELITYVFFGGLTTVVDWTVSFILYRTSMNVHAANVIAWTAAVLFAFFTNRKYVFKSERKGISAVTGELFAFAGSRLLSLGVQEILFFFAVDLADLPKTWVKIPVAVLVVIINYILGKWVFKKKTEEPGESAEFPETGVTVSHGAVVISDRDPASETGSDEE